MGRIEYDDNLQEEREEEQKTAKFVKHLLRLVNRGRQLKIKIKTERFDEITEHRLIRKSPTKNMVVKLFKRDKLLAQVVDRTRKRAVNKQDDGDDYVIVVFTAEDKKLAEKIAAFLTLIYRADKLKIVTSHKKIEATSLR